MALHQLSGPRLPPARGEATHLVVLSHGYGADGNDLIGLAPMWQRLLPTVAFVAPNAPQRCDAGFGYQWFPISRLDPHEMARGVESAAATLENFVEAELARLNLTGDKLALVGFSQGTMMSLHVGLKRGVKPAAIVGYSGMLADQTPAPIADAPPVMLIHGDADPMIPVGALFASAATLGGAGAAVQWHIAPGVGHSIDETGLVMGGEFLARAFNGQLARKAAEISCPVA
ncbi:MAG: alpha/beta hydrolase [Rhizomicrobium sp.]